MYIIYLIRGEKLLIFFGLELKKISHNKKSPELTRLFIKFKIKFLQFLRS